MSTIEEIKIPEFLLKKVRDLAEKEGITVEQFISSAIAEKASAWITVEYLKERATRGSHEKFLQALSRIPNVDPDERDRL